MSWQCVYVWWWGRGYFFKSLMSKWSKQLEKVSCDVHEGQIDTKSSAGRGLKVKQLFSIWNLIITGRRGEKTEGRYCFPELVSNQLRILLGPRRRAKRSQPPRSLPRKTFIKEPSPGSARIPLSPSRIPKDTNRCAGGGDNYARPVCSPSSASLWLQWLALAAAAAALAVSPRGVDVVMYVIKSLPPTVSTRKRQWIIGDHCCLETWECRIV